MSKSNSVVYATDSPDGVTVEGVGGWNKSGKMQETDVEVDQHVCDAKLRPPPAFSYHLLPHAGLVGQRG